MTPHVDDHVPRLAVYGTLAPGRPNHGVLAHLPGRWSTGFVRGHLHDAGWGADLGFPGLVLSDDGDDIAVHVLESTGLDAEWQHLDEFEGPGYRRVAVEVRSAAGAVAAQIYVLAVDAPIGDHSPGCTAR